MKTAPKVPESWRWNGFPTPGGSGTRHDETLVAPTELALMHQLRRALGGQDRRQSLQQLLDHLRTTGTNAEFLRRAARG